jgi:ABC-type transport system substrate-binding protein
VCGERGFGRRCQLSLVSQGRELGRKPVRFNLVQADGSVEILETLLAEVAERNVEVLLLVFEQGLCCLRDKYLTTVASGADSCRPVHRKAGVAAVGHHRLPGMDAHPYLDLHSVRPAVGQNRALTLDRGTHRFASADESDEERIALRINLVAAVIQKGSAEQLLVLGEDLTPLLPQLLDETRRALDVREQEGDRSPRQLGHARSVTARQTCAKWLARLEHRFACSLSFRRQRCKPTGVRLSISLLLTVTTVSLLGGSASAVSLRDGGSFRIAVAAIGDTGLPRFAAIDPALSGVYLAEPIVLRPACATLTAYPDVALPAGVRLKPDLAIALPKVAAGGKTYTFTVRKGLRFNTGVRVTAASFAHAIDRILNPAMKSELASSFVDIVGAKAVLDGKAKTASGVTARGNRLVVRLTKPAGDLSTRMASVCAVPPNLPIIPEGVPAPIPSPAPYYVAQYKAGELVVLERNRFYRGRRPRHVNRFVVTLDNDENRILEQVERGEADWAYAPTGVGGLDGAELARKYGVNRSRFFIKPGFDMWTFHLNNSRPLFKNNLPLRRAVNLAIDRAALVRARGPRWGRAADHHLPPTLAGSAQTHIYPLARPDLAKARALARGHTRGGHATLYACTRVFCTDAAQILRDNLKLIGLDVEIRQFPSPLLFEKYQTQGEPFDIGWIGFFSLTPPDPGSLLSSWFDGRTIGAPGGFSNYSYFQSPHYNRLLDKGARLGPRTRYRFYGRLDIDLARNAAPMAVYAVSNVFTFVSKRTGCVVLNPSLDLTAVWLK